MVNYTRIASTAQRLINDNGRDVSLKRISRTPGDSNKPWRGPAAAEESFTVKAVVFPYEEKDVDGSIVRLGDKRMYVAANALGQEMATMDAVEDGGVRYRIVVANIIAPGAVSVVYEIQLRRQID